jgi:hypothetical protein
MPVPSAGARAVSGELTLPVVGALVISCSINTNDGLSATRRDVDTYQPRLWQIVSPTSPTTTVLALALIVREAGRGEHGAVERVARVPRGPLTWHSARRASGYCEP